MRSYVSLCHFMSPHATGEASALRAPSFQELPAWTAADAVRQALRSPGRALVTGRDRSCDHGDRGVDGRLMVG